MKLKTTQIDGKTYAEVNEQGLPIYVYDDGKEVAHDAAQTVATITRLNGEAKSNRERYEAAESSLATFAGIDDPVAAKKAVETLKNFDDKKDLSYQLKNINVKRILNDDEVLRKIYDVSLHLEGLYRNLNGLESRFE